LLDTFHNKESSESYGFNNAKKHCLLLFLVLFKIFRSQIVKMHVVTTSLVRVLLRIMSCALENRDVEKIAQKPMQDDQPVNEKFPNWNLYRMSRMGQCESLSNDSSQVSVNSLEKNLQLLRQSKVYRL
jgi:hypothetical protein